MDGQKDSEESEGQKLGKGKILFFNITLQYGRMLQWGL
jgi:hypothetical protein